MRNMIKAILAVASVFLLTTVVSYSQPVDKFAKKDQIEISGTIGFTNTTPVNNGNTDDSWTYTHIAPSVGYFIADGCEVGGMIDYQNYSSGSYGTTMYTIYIVPSYHFKTNSMAYPYIQGQLGYTGISDVSRSGLAWGLEGGVKMNIVPHGLLKFGVNYSQLTQNRSSESNRNGSNILSFTLGLGIFL